jgi:hypothetical protein
VTKPPEIELPERLQYLVKYCEKACVAECCGIDAFDFSPLHIASYTESRDCALVSDSEPLARDR